MDWEWELVAGPFDYLTEGPAWDGRHLLFTHIPGNRIMRYSPETGECTVYRDGTVHHQRVGLRCNRQSIRLLRRGPLHRALRGRREHDHHR